MKLNNKGFTLVEVLVTVGIIVLISVIAVPNVLRALNSGREQSYNIMVQSIKTAAINLYEEVYSNDLLGDTNNTIFAYNYEDGRVTKGNAISLANPLEVSFQTLVSNGYLSGSTSNNNDTKTLYEPKENKPIGYCTIEITRNVNNNKVTYTVAPKSGGDGCPDSYE